MPNPLPARLATNDIIKPLLGIDDPDREVRSGLQNERDRILQAMVTQDYYEGRNEDYIPKRQVEATRDYVDRPKVTLDLVTQAVDALTRNEYSPPPARTLEGSAEAATWLAEVYADASIDMVIGEANTLATTNGNCAIQIEATGDPKRPIRFQLWGAEEFAVWTDPDDATKPYAVATVDRQDNRTRYRLWTNDRVLTYLTKKLDDAQTAGGRVAELVSTDKHEYGVLPFAFVHYRKSMRKFWNSGPGDRIRRLNTTVDVQLSNLAEAVEKFNLRPIITASNVDPKWVPLLKPGAFIHLPSKTKSSIVDDDMRQATLTPMQVEIDVESVWLSIENAILAKLESLEIPRSAVRMEQAGVASGIALVVEQAPMLLRAMKRRPGWVAFETELATVTLACGGNHYGNPALVEASKDVRLSLLWPEPRVPIPDPIRDELDQNALNMGIKSVEDICMERYGMTQDQAQAHLKRVAEANKRFEALHPAPTRPPATSGAPVEPPAGGAANGPDGDGPDSEGPADTIEDEANV